MKLTHGSLFSGIGGIDLAVEAMGWENIFHCEINEPARKLLNHHFPKSISYADITQTDFTIHRGTIDFVSGGFPCQPFSRGGHQKGKSDDRYLWHEMFRAIREIEPFIIMAENVSGILDLENGLQFEEICLDLESEGYEVQPILFPASSIGFQHHRERMFFIAYSHRIHVQRWKQKNESKSSKIPVRQLPLPASWLSKKEILSTPTLCGNVDGVSDRVVQREFRKWRNTSLHQLGNAVVPAVAKVMLEAIDSMLKTMLKTSED